MPSPLSNGTQDATVHLTLRAASSEDVHRLIPSIRALDAEALSLLGIKDVTAHLIGAMEPSHECLAVETQEGVSGIAGIVLITPPTHTLTIGYLWLVSTESLNHHTPELLKSLLERWSPLCDAITACCLVKDTGTSGALESEGFTPTEKPSEFGDAGPFFLQFTRVR
jgi:hypothetical protein